MNAVQSYRMRIIAGSLPAVAMCVREARIQVANCSGYATRRVEFAVSLLVVPAFVGTQFLLFDLLVSRVKASTRLSGERVTFSSAVKRK
jgi:hypothetical protein